ncbi:hypothetical protein N7495_000727 [Penicillium taxi]|uniref:uncharacterized protein n=1 Tax=Penicillium taxi TaxID=168475 RepID=UPI002545BD9C|nr:uncharacterized protein N7495_000727 [Penicillium taxi]KAJ5908045.1 hypothetical protein N7495_000727 [Penicillium taxi]
MADTNGISSNSPVGDASTPLTQVRPGGAPSRVYLNAKVVPQLLEGMKLLAKDQPAMPLKVLGEFLLRKSNEIEGNDSE